MNPVATLLEINDAPPRGMAAAMGCGREAIAFLGLSQLPGVAFNTLVKLGGASVVSNLLDLRSVEEVESRLKAAGAKLGRETVLPKDWDDFGHMLWRVGQDTAGPLIERGIRFLFFDDPRFPSRLKAMPEAIRPQWIFVAGDLDLFERPSLTIVGTRDVSETGSFDRWMRRRQLRQGQEWPRRHHRCGCAGDARRKRGLLNCTS